MMHSLPASQPAQKLRERGATGQNGWELRVGRWRLVRLLAQGSWTRVFQAQPVDAPADLPPLYALKLLRPECCNDARAAEGLRREARAGLALSHPHVVSVLAAQVASPPEFVVMPYLPGSNVDRRLLGGRRLAPETALWIARQAAEGLAALHEHGWVHADVKPANLRVSPQGHVTLLDLGLAHRLDEKLPRGERMARGTPTYMAPEAFSAGALTPAADVYGLGATLFELVAGRPPFLAPSAARLAEAHRRETPPDLASLVATSPAGLARLVRRMMAKDPLRRPRSASELVDPLIDLELSLLGASAAFAGRLTASTI
jgi:serine/threonine-protein kinase